jgi:DNA-binding transcriptional MerR regulator
MNRATVTIPEKIFFKIGEVCELTGIQAHVLRYWESEFPMLAPQKNRAGQRTYRKRDVEMVLHIKQLLYEEQYTIAGAKKKLISDIRSSSKLKVVPSEESSESMEAQPETIQHSEEDHQVDEDYEEYFNERQELIDHIKGNLNEILKILENNPLTPSSQQFTD